MPTAIIVPSRYPDIFNECRRRINFFAAPQQKILVRDGHDIADPQGWTTIQAPKPFVYSRNINLGINQTSGDVLLTNDDVRFFSKDTIGNLEAVMAQNPNIGILSPRIDGGVGNIDQEIVKQKVRYTTQRLAFVCVLIRRAVIDQIGLLDERFDGYGWDDVDYCRRAVNAGWKMAVTADATVRHGHKTHKCSSSYARDQEYRRMVLHAQMLYRQKWGDCKFENFDKPMTREIWQTQPRVKKEVGSLTREWFKK